MPFILIAIGLILIIYNYHGIKKESSSFDLADVERKSFKSVLDNNKEELNDYKIELGIFRRDIAESLTELQGEIIEIKKSISNLKKYHNRYENNIDDIKMEKEYNELENSTNLNVEKKIGDDVVSEINFSNLSMIDENEKTVRIKDLLSQGLTEEEICHKLSVSKGEVLLVKGLFKK